MSVTRGEFLKQLGKSLPGMVLGSGAALAAAKIIGKAAAASGMGQAFAEEVASDAKKTAGTNPPAGERAQNPDFIYRGPATGNRIALTFDDGPTPGVTELILDELKRRSVHATFFMIGERIAAAPELARRVLAEGHEIGNHTYTHPHLDQLPPAQVDAEIQKTQDIIRDTLGITPKWFRPPYGALRANQTGAVIHRGMRIGMWSVDTRDWSQPGVDQIISSALADPQPGGIILCHDCHAQTVEAVGAILDGMTKRGLAQSTLGALFE